MIVPSITTPALFPNDLPRLTHGEMAEEILDWLGHHSQLKIHETSRIPAVCKLVLNTVGRTSHRGDPKHVELEQSMKDVQELWYIVRVLDDHLGAEPFVKPLLRTTSNDTLLPENSGNNTVGRDAQFELFIAAVGYRVGFGVTHQGERQPDWLMSTEHRRWSVECKRAKSNSAVQRLTRSGANQIQISNVGGIIAIDVSPIGGPEKRRLREWLPDEALNDARERMGDAILTNGLPTLQRAIGDSPVRLLIIHDYLIRPSATKDGGESTPWLLAGMWWAYNLESGSSTQFGRYDEFWNLFKTGLPNL